MEVVPIAIAFTPNYIVPVATMLRSLMDASICEFRIICLVSEDIPIKMQEMLQQLGIGRLSFVYIPMKGRLDGYYIDPRYSEASSYRLLVADLIPEYDKIIYMDSDVIVRQDMGELYRKTDLGNNYLAAVSEAPIEGQAERMKALGCTPGVYFNAGIILMNLRQIRKDGISQKLMKACEKDYMEFPDQDALNQVCQGRVLPLSPVYNSIRTFFLPQYKADFCKIYSEELWKMVQREGNIHYTGGKPWSILSVKFGVWWRVFYSLPKEIRALLEVRPQIKLLSILYRIGFGYVIDLVIIIYRAIAYNE